MTEKNIDKCKGHQFCERAVFADDFCRLHLPLDHEDSLSRDEFDHLLLEEIKDTVINENDLYVLHWEGLNFPKEHILLEHFKFDEVKEQLEKSWINISDSNIQNIRIESYAIRELIISRSTVHGNTIIPVMNINRLSMDSTRFLGKFHCSSESREVDARNAIFEDEFSFSSTVKKLTNFTNCRFKTACLFHGYRSNIFSNENVDEFKIVGFDNAIFESPTQVIFQDIDLRNTSFKSVSLIGVRFYNTNFYQKELNRNGLYNEVNLLRKTNSVKLNTHKKNLNNNYTKEYDHLIHEYRQLRMAMENIKDYDNSHDFYAGEMEARKRRKWNFILEIYRFSSFYGTNYKRALLILLGLFLTHLTLTIILSTNFQVQKLFCGQDITASWIRMGDILLHSINTVTLQRINLLSDLSFWQRFSDTFLRILFPTQVAMFVLALRNKTKR